MGRHGRRGLEGGDLGIARPAPDTEAEGDVRTGSRHQDAAAEGLQAGEAQGLEADLDDDSDHRQETGRSEGAGRCEGARKDGDLIECLGIDRARLSLPG